MLVNLDRLANGQTFLLGGVLCKKLSDLICQEVESGRLLYDARLYYKTAEPVIVEWPIVEQVK